MDNNAIEFRTKYSPRRLRNGKLIKKTSGLLMTNKKIRKQREDLVYEKKAQRQAKHAKHPKITGNWPI